jgi:uncharacterized protein YraI
VVGAQVGQVGDATSGMGAAASVHCCNGRTPWSKSGSSPGQLWSMVTWRS